MLLEFLGGLELHCPEGRTKIELPDTDTLVQGIPRLAGGFLNKPELLVDEQGNLQDGILFLINDADATLYEDEMVRAGAKLVFISMLHGG